MKNIVIIVLAFLIFHQSARADKMKDFLMSCVYGTAAGALLGVASLVVSDDPGSKTNNIARGASLGLYAGIGFGLYVINERPKATEAAAVWLQPKWSLGQIDGAQVSMTAWKF